MAFFKASDRDRLRRATRPFKLSFQGVAPALATTEDDSLPATICAGQRVKAQRETRAPVTPRVWLWIPRRNWGGGANANSNPIAPVGGAAGNQVLKRTRPVDWTTGALMPVGEKRYNPLDTKSYVCNTEHTSGATFAADAAKWTEITGAALPVECREVFTTFRRATLAAKCRVAHLAGDPATDGLGTGWHDLALAEGLTTYTWSELEAAKDTIFTQSAAEATPWATFRSAATASDIIWVLPQPLPVDHVFGLTVTAGDIRRDRKTWLPEHFGMASPQRYFTAATAGGPAAAADAPTSVTHVFGSNAALGAYVDLAGIGVTLAPKDVVAATAGKTWRFEVEGVVTADPTDGTGRIAVQCISLNGSYNQVGSTIGTTFFPTVALTSKGAFRYTLRVSNTAAGAVLAWDAAATWLRFRVLANSGEAGAPSIRLTRMNVIDEADATPTYWRALADHVSAISAPGVFPTTGRFAALRAGADAAKWEQVTDMALVGDYEAADRRPYDATDDTSPGDDENVVHLFTYFGQRCAANGLLSVLYTNTVLLVDGTAANNAIGEQNLDALLGAVSAIETICDADTAAGNAFASVVALSHARLAWQNGTPGGTPRANFTPAKFFPAFELVSGPNRSFPITGISVGAGPTFQITVTAPGNNFSGGRYVRIGRLKGCEALNGGTFKLQNVVAGTSFRLTHRLQSVDVMTGTITEVAIDGAALAPYVAGGTAETGGTTLADIVAMRDILAARQCDQAESWRYFAEVDAFTTDAGDLAPEPAWKPITAISRAAACVVTAPGHGLVASATGLPVAFFPVVSGMAQIAGGSYAIEVIDADSFRIGRLAGTVFQPIDSSAFDAFTGTGFVVPRLKWLVNTKIAALTAGWQCPLAPPPGAFL